MTCGEVACDLRYLPIGFDWSLVVAAFKRRGEPLDADGRERERERRRRLG